MCVNGQRLVQSNCSGVGTLSLEEKCLVSRTAV